MKFPQLQGAGLERYRRYYQTVEEFQKKPHTHAYMIVAFTFLTISLFGWYAVRPTLQTILYLRREIKDKTEVNKKMDDKIRALIEAQATYSDIEQSIPLVAQALPPDPDAMSLLSQLRNLALISAASISSLRVSEIPASGQTASPSGQKRTASSGPIEFSLTITLTGVYEQLISFLSGMIDMRRIVAVDAVAISPDINQRNEKSGPLQLVLKVRSYFLPEGSHGK